MRRALYNMLPPYTSQTPWSNPSPRGSESRGRIIQGHPSLGAWTNYGLGTLNENLPGFVVMLDPRGGPISGAKNWSAGYMPASFQATLMRSQASAFSCFQGASGSIPAAIVSNRFSMRSRSSRTRPR